MTIRNCAIAALLVLPLANCGTTSPNSDVGVVHIAGVSKVADTASVAIVPTGPAPTSESQKVVGTSCKNKVWDPDPSKENAINLMKRQAADRGFNAVHSVEVKPDSAAVFKNCWTSLVATGVAFRK